LVWEYFGRSEQGVFAEVGANDPELLSQTLFLEKLGWRGVLVEPQPDCCRRLREKRPNAKIFEAACGSPEQRGTADFHIANDDTRSSLRQYEHDESVHFSSVLKVKVQTLDEILEEAGIERLDFLSVDVEGCELEVFKGLDLKRHQPRLIIVEDYAYTLKLHRHLARAGYRLVKRTGSSNWYVPRGSKFAFSSPMERVKLFRKMFLGTPLRRWRLRLRGQPVPGN